jgi:hypothetical protein
MKIQPLMALVVLSLAAVPGARAAVRGFKARILGLLTLACLLTLPATAQVNYAVSGNMAYVGRSPGASGAIAIPNSVTNIRDDAFIACPSLTNFSVAAANPAYSIWTNPPPGTSTDFVDPEWLNHPNRIYRARSD